MRIIKIVFAMAGLTLMAMQCQNTNPKPTNPIDLLPPITQTGENTLGCLVNGEALVVTNSNDIGAIYQKDVLQMSATMRQNDQVETIGITIYGKVIEDVNYDLNNQMSKAGYSILYSNNEYCIYEEFYTFDGSVVIDFLDSVAFIVSGHFEFTTVKDNCDTVRITDGRFDFKYIP